jgi:hypothetical protein
MDRDEALAAGYRYYCRDCLELYREIPVALTETTHGQRPVPCCDECGSGHLANISDDKEPQTL